MFEGIANFVATNELVQGFFNIIGQGLQDIADFVNQNKSWLSPVVEGLILGGGLKLFFTTIIAPIGAFVASIGWIPLAIMGVTLAVVELWKHWDEVTENITKAIDGVKNAFKTAMDDAKAQGEIAKKEISDLYNTLKTALANAIKGVIDFFLDIGKKADENNKRLNDKLTSFFTGIKTKFFNFGKDIIKNLISGVKSMTTSLKNTITGIASPITSLVGNFNLGSIGSWIKGYASGGVVSTGELFVARESGAELVGKVGNHTTVMNNEQIVEAVSRGVAEAVASVMSGYGQNVVLNIDGKQIAKATVKNINQMTKQNGYSPLIY